MIIWLFGLWWTFDDHLAAALNNPGLGHIDWWVILLIALIGDLMVGAASNK